MLTDFYHIVFSKIVITVLLGLFFALLSAVFLSSSGIKIISHDGLIFGFWSSLQTHTLSTFKRFLKGGIIYSSCTGIVTFFIILISFVFAFFPIFFLPVFIMRNSDETILFSSEVLSGNGSLFFLYLFLVIGGLYKIPFAKIMNDHTSFFYIWHYLRKFILADSILLLLVLTIYISNQSSNVLEIVVLQNGPWIWFDSGWGLIKSPLAAIVFLALIILKNNIFPLGGVEQSFLARTYYSKMGGVYLFLHNFCRYIYLANMITIFVLFFMSGSIDSYIENIFKLSLNNYFYQLLNFGLKFCVVLCIIMLFSRNFVALKEKQLFAWVEKYILSTAIINLFITFIIKYWSIVIHA